MCSRENQDNINQPRNTGQTDTISQFLNSKIPQVPESDCESQKLVVRPVIYMHRESFVQYALAFTPPPEQNRIQIR